MIKWVMAGVFINYSTNTTTTTKKIFILTATDQLQASRNASESVLEVERRRKKRRWRASLLFVTVFQMKQSRDTERDRCLEGMSTHQHPSSLYIDARLRLSSSSSSRSYLHLHDYDHHQSSQSDFANIFTLRNNAFITNDVCTHQILWSFT